MSGGMEGFRPVHLQDACRYASHNGQLSSTPRHAIAEAPTCSASFPTPVAPLALPSYDAVEAREQSNYYFQTHDGAISIPIDVYSTSKPMQQKRKREAMASKRFRERRKAEKAENEKMMVGWIQKVHRNEQRIAELEQELLQMTESCGRYREERDYLIYQAQAQTRG